MAKKAAFDKEKWLEETKVRVEKAKAALEAGLASLQSSDDWRRTLEAMAALGPARLGRLSFRNALLVLMERPDARHVATYATWLRLGRQVAKGSKSLTILRPRFAPKGAKKEEGEIEGASDEPGMKLVGFKPLSVFALEQTEGPDLPAPRVEKDLQTPEGFAWGVEQLRQVALQLPGISGIELRPRQEGDPSKARGWYVPKTRQIVVVTEATPAMQFRCLAHEIAHSMLHPEGDHHSTPEREVEAESTAFVVCHALGFDTSDVSFPYVAEWAHGSDAAKQLATTGQRILQAATRLLEPLMPEVAEDEAGE